MDPKEKWNNKYRQRLKKEGTLKCNERLSKLESYLTGGKALDIASGLGRNSLYLAERNYEVTALDISEVALNYLQEQSDDLDLPIRAQVYDLSDVAKLEADFNQSFDLIIVSYYLDRNLFPFIKKSINDGGYFFMETYYESAQESKAPVSDRFKLQEQELLKLFSNWHILFYEEDEQTSRQTIFCRKIK